MSLLSKRRMLVDTAFKMQQVNCTSDAASTTNTPIDITGMTVTVASPGPQAVWVVWGSLDTATTDTSLLVALLVADGVTQGGQIIVDGVGSLRYPGMQTWRVTSLPVGNRVIKMMVYNFTSAGTATVYNTHSAMQVLRVT